MNSSGPAIIDDGFIPISYFDIAISLIPMALIIFAAYLMRLRMTELYVVGIIRTLAQLSAIGFILVPVFEAGEREPYIVFLYVLLMVLLAAYEATARPKYYFKGIYLLVAFTIALSLTLMSMYTFLLLIQATPLWDPRYTIPICGMLLGNNVSAVSLALNSLLTNLNDRREDVELMITFGGTRFEASLPFVREAVRVGLTPTLNQMVVIGIVSLPGMMTGQILGGTAPVEAARYQIMIMYLLASCSFLTVLLSMVLSLRQSFDTNHTFLRDRFIKRDGKNKDLITKALHYTWRLLTSCCRKKKANSKILEEAEKALEEGTRSLQPFTFIPIHSSGANRQGIKLEDVARTIVDRTTKKKRKLFEGVTRVFQAGEIALVSGPSGSGKSQFLRLIGGLDPLLRGQLYLYDDDRSSMPMAEWRKRVRLISQVRVMIPGTPRDFMKRVSKLAVYKDDLSLEQLLESCTTTMVRLGLEDTQVDLEWKDFSGGEAQRMLFSIAIATGPEALLLDEPDSGLDHRSKLVFEEVLKDYVSKKSATALWVSHDEDQIERLKAADKA